MNTLSPQQTYRTIHPDFRWNGQKLDRIALKNKAEIYQASAQKYHKEIGYFLEEWLDESPLIKVQTSGSTGEPKVIEVKKQQMANSALATGRFFHLPEKTSALLCLPATYIAGKLMIVRALILGWHLDSVKPQARPFKVHHKNYDFSAITPYQLGRSIQELPLLKQLIVGGGKVSQALKNRVRDTPTTLYETYGMTETLTHIAARKINGIEQENPPFSLLKGVEIEKDDRNCLIIRAPHVADQTIYTNDLVELTSPTSFRLLGRWDNIINSGSVKIIPERVEYHLSSLIPQRFFIAGIPDKEWGEKVALFIEASSASIDTRQLQSKIAQLEKIDKYERPKAIYLLDQFVETHSGKINRLQTLREKLQEESA